MTSALAPAKINLALVVGPLRPDGKHEVVTVLERLTLADSVRVEPAAAIVVEGFAADTIVRSALELLRSAAGHRGGWSVTLEKEIPVAAGLGGGSSDAATALRLANDLLPAPIAPDRLHLLAAAVGADVPFFLTRGAQVGTADGSELRPISLPRNYMVVLVLPDGPAKTSTASVYAAFDARQGERGFASRCARLQEALSDVACVGDLALLPPNDLASSPLADDLLRLGAARADVSGAGPTVYGLFADVAAAEHACLTLADRGRTWLVRPA